MLLIFIIRIYLSFSSLHQAVHHLLPAHCTRQCTTWCQLIAPGSVPPVANSLHQAVYYLLPAHCTRQCNTCCQLIASGSAPHVASSLHQQPILHPRVRVERQNPEQLFSWIAFSICRNTRVIYHFWGHFPNVQMAPGWLACNICSLSMLEKLVYTFISDNLYSTTPHDIFNN